MVLLIRRFPRLCSNFHFLLERLLLWFRSCPHHATPNNSQDTCNQKTNKHRSWDIFSDLFTKKAHISFLMISFHIVRVDYVHEKHIPDQIANSIHYNQNRGDFVARLWEKSPHPIEDRNCNNGKTGSWNYHTKNHENIEFKPNCRYQRRKHENQCAHSNRLFVSKFVGEFGCEQRCNDHWKNC